MEGDVQKEKIPGHTKQDALAARSKSLEQQGNVLSSAKVYLSGPMDFVASRTEEKRTGWRTRVGQFMRKYGTEVRDPWNKPVVVGMPHYGKEDEFSTNKRYTWTYEDSEQGDRIRSDLCGEFWATLHTDLRMVDTSDFLIAYCPTNIYSVGTVHEIVMARLQNKPVLFVSPPVSFPSLDRLEAHLESASDGEGQRLLTALANEAPLRPNPSGIPSMWYMALLDGHYFFDGFGFAAYAERFGWEPNALDEREEAFPPKRPLLPYLEKLNRSIPKRYDPEQDAYVENADWLIFGGSDTE
ncbi:hypothetical protein IH601_10965 [Candidatus Bipolaricaulota bacterium]|nr:hypothetical protein [Candidatus Bipolaricaulota bacterium]